MQRPIKILDVVASLSDLPAQGVVRGDVGTVVDLPGQGAVVTVEFVDSDGQTRALVDLAPTDLLPLRGHSTEPPVCGVVDSGLWYWYDPNDDLLDVRVLSRRSVSGVSELLPDGVTLLRDPADGDAIGLIVRGFWQRFGGGDPEQLTLEAKVSALRPRLAA